MCMLQRRLQVLVDDDRYARLAAVAEERGVSVARVVRESIDRGLTAAESGRRSAAHTILDAADMEVPHEPADLRHELEALRGRRG